MEFSNEDLILRWAGIALIEKPKSNHDVKDSHLHQLLHIIGQHQKVLLIPRCYLLRSFEPLCQCSYLIILDISHTHIKNLDLLLPLQVLRGLSLSGTTCDSYEPLNSLYSLEILTLNFSSILSVDCLNDLFKLRSLDIGNTAISSLQPLVGQLTRLEELFIDNTNIYHADETVLGRSLDLVRHSPNMKYLNVGRTDLRESLLRTAALQDRHVIVDTKARNLVWFEAVIDNDVKTVLECMQHGQDINLPVGLEPPTADMLARRWTKRGGGSVIGGGTGAAGARSGAKFLVFFDCYAASSDLRPCAVHLALYFNCKDVLVVLVTQNVIRHITAAIWVAWVIR